MTRCRKHTGHSCRVIEFSRQVSTAVQPDRRPKFVGANTALRAICTDPDAAPVVDTRGDPLVVKTGAGVRVYRLAMGGCGSVAPPAFTAMN
jgi:hypothetical protein